MAYMEACYHKCSISKCISNLSKQLRSQVSTTSDNFHNLPWLSQETTRFATVVQFRYLTPAKQLHYDVNGKTSISQCREGICSGIKHAMGPSCDRNPKREEGGLHAEGASGYVSVCEAGRPQLNPCSRCRGGDRFRRPRLPHQMPVPLDLQRFLPTVSARFPRVPT